MLYFFVFRPPAPASSSDSDSDSSDSSSSSSEGPQKGKKVSYKHVWGEIQTAFVLKVYCRL